MNQGASRYTAFIRAGCTVNKVTSTKVFENCQIWNAISPIPLIDRIGTRVLFIFYSNHHDLNAVFQHKQQAGMPTPIEKDANNEYLLANIVA